MSSLYFAVGGLVAGRFLELCAAARRASSLIAAWSAAERGRLFLWTPVAIGAGAAWYFTLRAEPPPLAAPALTVVAATVSVLSARMRLLAGAVALVALGFAVADWRAERVAAPQISRELSPRTATGTLIAIDEAPALRRLIISLETVEGLAPHELPARARLTWRGKAFDALPGDLLSFRAGLSPPPAPAIPGGFDHGRQLYFQRIGALGYVVSPPVVLARPQTPAGKARSAIENARLALTRRILAAAPGDGGALVAASITGKRAAISPEAQAHLRDSGLAHLVAISGLNMALATGIVFFTVRFLAALIPAVALRYPVKKWAAVAALLVGVLYLLISGGDWSAERAFIMTSIFFIAILFDRRAFTLRNIAIAALVILMISPEAVIHPGFQMSFAAVTALIAAYEWQAQRLDPDRSFTLFARARRYVAGLVATDVVASTATGPFAIYHFNRAALFGLPANVVSIPIVGFWMMPAAMIALILLPLGLDEPLWRLAAAGAEAVLWIGRRVSSWPNAVQTFPQWPPGALAALTLGGLWLCLQAGHWRLAGLVALPLAAIMIAAARPADLFVSEDGANAAIVLRDGAAPALALYHPGKDKFEARAWKEEIGTDADAAPTRAVAEIGRCDAAGCVARVNNRTIAISEDPLSLRDDCARADLVVALYPVARRQTEACRTTLVDRRAAWEGGALAVWLGPGGTRIVSVADFRANRPWAGASTPTAGATYKSWTGSQ
jgi:competence protein ComEC